MQKSTFSLRAWASVGLAVVVVAAFAWVAQSVSRGGPGAVSTATSVPAVATATDIVVTATSVPESTATPVPAATATEWAMGSAPTDSAPALSVPQVTPWLEASDSQPYLTATRAEPVYVRSGPGLAYAEWATLATGHKFAVIGQVTSWWKIDMGMGGSAAWVKQSEVEFTGDWNKVPYQVMPTLPPPPGASPTP